MEAMEGHGNKKVLSLDFFPPLESGHKGQKNRA